MAIRSYRENCGICHAITCEHTRAARAIQEAVNQLDQPALGSPPPDPRDAEIARLNLRVAQLTSGSEAANLAGRVVEQDREIARLKAEVERVTEVARLLVGECEEQRECPVCGTDTNVELCRPSCYVVKMRKVLDDKKGGG